MAGDSHEPQRLRKNPNPILIQSIRGDAPESIYRGAFSVVDAHGKVIMTAGDTDVPVFPRSGIKPIQALALCETGAAKAFGLGHANIALACSSHSGEPTHTEIIENWLAKIGCSHDDLVCGPSLPWTEEARTVLIKSEKNCTTLHDNCSGKHTGFLTIAKHLGHPILGYNRMDHPVQQRVIGIIEQMTGMDLFDAPKAIDGCGIPTLGIPLGNISLAMARLGNPHDQPEERQAACKRVVTAMTMEPFLVAGKGRFCTRVMEALGQSCIVKMGAQGVYCGTLIDRGLGVAIKIDDGSLLAAEAVMMRLLHKLNILTEQALGRLLNLLEPPIFSRSREVVGFIKPVHPALS